MSEHRIRVWVCHSRMARQWLEVAVDVAEGTQLAEAIRSSGVLAGLSNEEVDALHIGVWSRKQPLDYLVRDGDRVELCRPLKVDPKVARRERFTRQGARTAGLFSKRRAGAKSGY